MTKLKVCSKIHLFIIISAILIAVGIAVGTVCHFCAGGFFNYGGEFDSYKSVTVTYSQSEYIDETVVKEKCDGVLKDFNAYEVSVSDSAGLGGEIVYKYAYSTDSDKLNAAVEQINALLNEGVAVGERLNLATMHEGTVKEGGSKAIIFASIAVASAAAFQFIYFVIRYKLRAAYSALLSNVHNLGIYVALLALTRIPVGTDAIAIGAAVVIISMILNCVLFDRTRKNFKDEKYAKTDRVEVVETSAAEVRVVTVISLGALAGACLLYGVLATIAQLWIGAFAPAIVAILGVIACCYGTVFFTPAVHSAIDGASEKALAAIKNKPSDRKVAKPAAKEV